MFNFPNNFEINFPDLRDHILKETSQEVINLGFQNRPHLFDSSTAQLASVFGRNMPEFYTGEHFSRAELIRRGTFQEICQEYARLLLFRMSNSLDGHLKIDQWYFLTCLIQHSGMLEVSLDLVSFADHTARAFLDMLFREAIFHHVSFGVTELGDSWSIIKWLLSSGFSFDGIVVERLSPLNFALQNYQFELAVSLISAGADLNPTTQPPLNELIARFGNKSRNWNRQSALGLLQTMIDSGAQLNDPDDFWSSPLCRAINTGDTTVIDLLIQSGANTCPSETIEFEDCIFRLRCSVLGLCVTYQRTELLSMAEIRQMPDEDTALRLLRYMLGVFEHEFPNSPITEYITPDIIIATAIQGYATVMEYFRHRVPTIDIQNTRGETPLHAAALYGHSKLCKLLLHWGHSADKASQSGLSPLHLACLQGDRWTVQLLIRHGANVERIWILQEPECQLLDLTWIEEESVDVLPGSHITPLFTALRCSYKSPGCAIDLIEAGAPVPKDALLNLIKVRNNRYRFGMPLDYHLFSILLDRGADPSASDDYSTVLQAYLRSGLYSPFCLATPLQDIEQCVGDLLDQGAKVTGGEALIAIELGSLPLIKRLVESGASCLNTGPFGERAMEIAFQSCHDGLPHVFIDFPLEYDAGALCAATRAALILPNGNRYWVERLPSRRPLGGSADQMEGTALSLAIRHRDYGMIDLILRFIPMPEFATLPFTLHDPFRHEVSYPRPSVSCWVDTLEDNQWHKTSSFWRSGQGCCLGSPIAIAVAMDDIELVRYLLNLGLIVDRLALSTAAAKNSLPLVKLLATALMSIPQRLDQLTTIPSREENPLCWAIRNQDEKMFQIIQSIGVGIQSHPYDDSAYGRSNLQQAVELGGLEIVKRLLDAGADVNEPPGSFRSATSLQLAAINGYLGIAKHLIDLGANVNAAGAEFGGRTALEGAAEHGRIDMIQLLLDHGADTSGDGQRAYVRAVKLAKRNGHLAAAKILREHHVWTEEDEDMLIEIWDEHDD